MAKNKFRWNPDPTIQEICSRGGKAPRKTKRQKMKEEGIHYWRGYWS